MSTFADMISRIANEVARDDLSAEIANAVRSAIRHHENTRFWFNETRDITFSLSSSQEFYTATDIPQLADLIEIDAVTTTVSNNRYPLTRRGYDYLEEISTGQQYTSLPYDYAFYGEQLRIYPIPNGAYPCRISGHIRLSLTSTASGSIAWMNEAQDLIRLHAKKRLIAEVIRPDDLSELATLEALETNELASLARRSTKALASGRFRSTYF